MSHCHTKMSSLQAPTQQAVTIAVIFFVCGCLVGILVPHEQQHPTVIFPADPASSVTVQEEQAHSEVGWVWLYEDDVNDDTQGNKKDQEELEQLQDLVFQARRLVDEANQGADLPALSEASDHLTQSHITLATRSVTTKRRKKRTKYRYSCPTTTTTTTVPIQPRFNTPQPLLVGAYYYPWWGDNRNDIPFHNGEGYVREFLNPPQLPALGEYDDSNTTVIEQHVRWSVEANIGVWISSWWGPDSTADVRTRCLLYTSPSPRD